MATSNEILVDCDECDGSGELGCCHCGGTGDCGHPDSRFGSVCRECRGNGSVPCEACDGCGAIYVDAEDDDRDA